MDNTDKLAVLIDADNAQPGIADDLLAEIANFGRDLKCCATCQ